MEGLGSFNIAFSPIASRAGDDFGASEVDETCLA